MKPHVVLIIGNGFDMDLGLKTSYTDFVNSRSLSSCTDNSIIAHLVKTFEKKRWIDIEAELRNLAIKWNHKDKGNRLLNAYFTLRDKLSQYIKELNYSDINSEASALKLLSIVTQDCNSSIFSFNYTDLHKICQSCQINHDFAYKSIHGKASDDSIIFGFDDDAEVKKISFCKMIKSHSQHFRSVNIIEDLDHADEVIFFGHSLGTTDYQYFRSFFSNQVKGQKIKDFHKKTIRIFTKDENSRLDILYQIRAMNNKQVALLYDLNDFRIYRTAKDTEEINQYLNSLRYRLNESPFY